MVRGLAVLLCLFMALPARADVRVLARVSITEQVVRVYHEGRHLFTWPVSTAKRGKVTPPGSFTPEFLSRNHRSSLYHNAPMPYAIFFRGNYAIHGTDHIRNLGRPASNGCVRLHADQARILFQMVRAEGMEQTRVVIVP